ncbi:DUF982 domain-containing protein [Candidatus Phyllobacterium onerii]|uniref:DUF982 domain-containing protein n=1 Tax=Candidatus Phyllobacterium onerii TaxID=3020828 RepID=UPI003A84AB35
MAIPATVLTSDGVECNIAGPLEALFLMLNHWPVNGAREYEDAMAICYSSLELPPMLEHSRVALRAAAQEAMILLNQVSSYREPSGGPAKFILTGF